VIVSPFNRRTPLHCTILRKSTISYKQYPTMQSGAQRLTRTMGSVFRHATLGQLTRRTNHHQDRRPAELFRSLSISRCYNTTHNLKILLPTKSLIGISETKAPIFLAKRYAGTARHRPTPRLSHRPTTNTSSSFASPKRSKSTQAEAKEQPRILPRVKRTPVVPYPLSAYKPVPNHIPPPPYASTGIVPPPADDDIVLHTPESIAKMRAAAQLARRSLDLACRLAVPGTTTDEIDTAVHEAIVAAGAYPSPLNYAGFPKSMCSSVNEVICHGIPDERPLQFGDVVSFDVSCFLNGVHGDNCATVIVGDNNVAEEVDEEDSKDSSKNSNSIIGQDWRGVPYRTEFATPECEAHFVEARRLVQAARDCLYAAIDTVKPGSCLSEIGRACEQTADRHGYQSVRKYRGHGISSDFHTAPFVKHYTNVDFLTLKEGMIFTIEPMIVTGNEACFEWDCDQWTVATVDGSLAAQFEHTVLVTSDGVEILTVP